MKTLNIVFVILLLFVNIIAGCIISGYEWWNVMASSTVLIANLILMIILFNIQLKDAFKYSLSLVFPFIAFIELVFSIISPSSFHDNGYIIIVMLLIVFQIMTLATVYYTSSKID